MALPVQPLPSWLQPVTLTYLNSDQRTTGLVQLPIPYSGPSIPLSWPFSSVVDHLPFQPAPTQTIINFYDGGGPFTVVAGTILTQPPSRPTPASPPPILPLATPLLAASSSSLPISNSVVISTVLVTLPPPLPSSDVQPVASAQQSAVKPASFTALIAGFLVLLVILVSIVLSLLMFIIRRRAQKSIHLDSPRMPYEFNSDLFPQNRHGSQTHPHHHLNRLHQQHDWALSLAQAEKPAPRPVHQTYQDSRDTRRLNAWKKIQKVLRQDFQSLLNHFSTQFQPSPIIDQSHHSPYPDHPHRFQNPNHDPSINTDTYQRVSRWFSALRTPASSFLRAPSSFKTLENQDDDEPELNQPMTFEKTSLVSSVKAWVISSDSPSPGHGNSPDQLAKSPTAQSSEKKKLGGTGASTNLSSGSSHNNVLDHRPLLETHQEEEEQAGSPNIGQDDIATDRTDSPLEHLQHLALSPLSTPIAARPSLSSPAPHPDTPPSLATSARRVRAKKSGLEISMPSASPRSVSYHSPAKIVVLKRRSDLISKPFQSPASVHAHTDSDQLSSGEKSPTLRFPLPQSRSASSGPRSAANQCVKVSLGALEPTSDILTPDDEDEIVYNASAREASIQQHGPRRSSISNLGGVSELGVVEKPQRSSVGLAVGSVEDNEGSYLSEELFYVRPKLAKFKDGKCIPENLDNRQLLDPRLSEIGGNQKGSQAQETGSNENRADSQSGPHQGSSTNKSLDFLRRSVSLPLSATALLQIKSGASPLDKLAQRSGLVGLQEDSDSDSSDSSSPHEKSRLLSHRSRYSRATLGQRLEVTSLKGSLAGLSGGSGGATSQNSSKLKGLGSAGGGRSGSGSGGRGGATNTSLNSRQQQHQRIAELSGGDGSDNGTTSRDFEQQNQPHQQQQTLIL